MRLLTGAIPAVALVMAFLLLGGYSLHGQRALDVRLQAAAIQERKRRQLREVRTPAGEGQASSAD